MFKVVDHMKKTLDGKRPFPQHTLKSIHENMLVEWTYNSNAIEGNTLTLSETKVVLEGITVGGKTIREHLEVINHRDAILFVEDIVKRNEPFSEWQLKNIHQLILKGIDDENAGKYRKENVQISGATHIPPEHFRLQDEMEQFNKWYEDSFDLHPVERATLVHAKFVKIHPFIDGNGRTARLLLNLELLKAGFPPIIIKKEDRLKYYDALDKAHTSTQYEDFIQLVVNALERTFELYFRLI